MLFGCQAHFVQNEQGHNIRSLSLRFFYVVKELFPQSKGRFTYFEVHFNLFVYSESVIGEAVIPNTTKATVPQNDTFTQTKLSSGHSTFDENKGRS